MTLTQAQLKALRAFKNEVNRRRRKVVNPNQLTDATALDMILENALEDLAFSRAIRTVVRRGRVKGLW